MPTKKKHNVITYEGCNYLKYRLVLSILSGKPVSIEGIRDTHDSPGLREYESNLLRLLEKLTKNPYGVVGDTGTTLDYTPGMPEGGTIEHDCNLQRGIGYYLDVVMALAPFCKHPVNITLRGVTNNTLDPSVDRIKTAGLPVLRRFIGDHDIELIINKRGAAPLGGGEVVFKCPIRQSLKSVQFQNPGKVKRIRGTACSVRVSPAIANRLVETSKGVLLKFIPDIYIHTDHCRKGTGGKSPGFGITLTAETTQGVFLSGEAFSPLMTTGSLPCVPEDLGNEAAHQLLDEIYRNGCVDSHFQRLTALFMALGKRSVSKVVVGPLTPAMIQFLRDLKDFFGVVFKLEYAKDDEGEEMNQVLMTCVGRGYQNLNKRQL